MYSHELLKDKHVVVTGGGTGLGQEMARHAAEVGARVTVCGRRTEPLEETVRQIRAAGGAAEAVSCNVRDPESVDAFVEAAEAGQGPITHLVNNAAANFLAATERLSPGGFDAVVRTNLYGTFYCTQACGQRWIDRGIPGTVVSIVTTYAETGSAFVVPSAVSKAGVLALTRSLAVEWGTYGIRLNAVAPGPFPTPGAWDRLVPDAGIEAQMRQRVPLGRFGTPRELSGLVLFLLSDLSAYMTGALVVFDGGEALASGGQFNHLTQLPREEALRRFEAMRARPGQE